jgi:L-Lysine epsilon oxidase N-terminal/L-lysine epsilon oxidase C-terminal domain/Iron-containing redox enzyme
MKPVAYCKIFPPIGIARLGDSPEEYFTGPEVPDSVPHRQEGFTFRDPQGRIRRQVARFRVVGFDEDGRVVGELTDKDATITWRARLANKKAAWFRFLGAQQALDGITGDREPTFGVRNATVGGMERIPDGPVGGKYRASAERAAHLEITPDEVEISGVSQQSDPQEQERRYAFAGVFKKKHPVYLGELRTDEAGRLLVFGGHGVSDAIDDDGKSIRDARWIQSYANNDDWFDDASDGYVRASVVLKATGQAVAVRGDAWVIVAAPDFAPDTQNLVTLFDVMEEVVYDNQDALLPVEFPAPRGGKSVIYEEDIRPILGRVGGYAWVNESALRGHGYKKPGDFRDSIDTTLGDPTAANKEGQKLREHIFGMLRTPSYPRPTRDGPPRPVTVDEATQRLQATASFMPPLSGDQGDRDNGTPRTWLSVTYLQYERLQAWSRGAFSLAGPPPAEPRPESEAEALRRLPYQLTRTPLDACAGGAFFPGLEMTSIARHPGIYSEAYRLNGKVLQPGDVTKHMALPWQADFFECRVDWWPAQRPDDVLTDSDFEEIVSSFQEETVGDPSLFESVVFNRKRWDRGLGVTRPSGAFLQNRLLPRPGSAATVDTYSAARADFVVARLLSLTAAPAYLSEEDVKAGVSYLERLPSPWRLQFLTQEVLDQYSGRFFHLVVPAPEASLDDVGSLRSSWVALCGTDPDRAISLLVKYAQAIQAELTAQVKAVFAEHPAASSTVGDFWQALGDDAGGVTEPPADFPADSPIFRRLRFADLASVLLDALYLRHAQQGGDMDMVDQWRTLGFVVRREKELVGRDGQPRVVGANVETDRSRYEGLSSRDSFYYLMNIAKYPDFVPFAKQLADGFLAEAEGFIEQLGLQDPTHPESFVEYNEVNYDAKLEQIYEILRAQANSTAANSPWLANATREEIAKGLLRNAAFNQTDGSWLRNISRAGTSDEARGLLFGVWSDETGNGNPALHHGNLYTTLLRELGFVLPDPSSRAYADHPGLSDGGVSGAVVPLAISQHTGEYYPELLGMTLFLEWEVLSLVPTVKRLDYFGIDSMFYRMHVGIDNATHGHGFAAKRAVQLYLDSVLNESGPEAVQVHWRRIWRGFVAFALSGGSQFSNDVGQSDEAIARRLPGTVADRVADLMQRKKRYGNLQHGNKKIGGFRLNDLFEFPSLFMEELAHSPWVTPGDPDQSIFLNRITQFNGPMYKVFDADDLELWREWVAWLGRDGDTAQPKRYLGKGEAMLVLLTELRGLAVSEDAHRRYRLSLGAGGAAERRTVADWFREPDLKKLMRALRDPANGWIVPGRPEESPLVVDLLQGTRRMGQALDRRFPSLGNQVGRLVVVRWILAGCPVPGDPAPPPEHVGAVKEERIRRLIVQQFGLGAVH